MDAPWAVCSTNHTILGSFPGATTFGQDMLIDLPSLAVWKEMGCKHQRLVNDTSDKVCSSSTISVS